VYFKIFRMKQMIGLFKQPGSEDGWTLGRHRAAVGRLVMSIELKWATSWVSPKASSWVSSLGFHVEIPSVSTDFLRNRTDFGRAMPTNWKRREQFFILDKQAQRHGDGRL
jgi:hypothetical protein